MGWGLAFGYIACHLLKSQNRSMPEPSFTPFRLSRNKLMEHEKQSLRDLAKRLSATGEYEHIRIPD